MSANAKHASLLLKSTIGIFKGALTIRITTLSIKVLRATLSIITINLTTQYHDAKCHFDGCHIFYAEYRYAKCRYAEFHYVECCNGERHYADCRNTECRGAILSCGLNVI